MRAGDQLRFYAISKQQYLEWSGGEAIKMRVIEEGLHTSIQDLGRIGYRSSGFPISGPMDSFSMKLANYLVGNKENTAVVEMSFVGPTIEWTKDAIISITGADMVPRLNGKQISLYRPIIIRSGGHPAISYCAKWSVYLPCD
ncbi:hypothetical protein [Gracilibacillus sp. JCM 18860]|uniref:hypothetical protein n=1 Tax=Gracilibacillus sp. JCM 18860 TaxID=1306159 RepID=UPI0006CF9E91